MKSPNKPRRGARPINPAPAVKEAGGLGAVAAAQDGTQAADAPAPLRSATGSAEASTGPSVVNGGGAPDLQALAAAEWNAKMEFALGMAVGTLHHLRGSGVDPVMAVQALLRAAGMGMEFYGVAERVAVPVEILKGREKQASFQAQLRVQQGQQAS